MSRHLGLYRFCLTLTKSFKNVHFKVFQAENPMNKYLSHF